MKLDQLEMTFGNGGKAIVKVWAHLHSEDDVDDLIAWLQMAKSGMKNWAKIHARSAQTAEATPKQNETSRPRQVRDKSQVA